jgi:hypothetical protein
VRACVQVQAALAFRAKRGCANLGLMLTRLFEEVLLPFFMIFSIQKVTQGFVSLWGTGFSLMFGCFAAS